MRSKVLKLAKRLGKFSLEDIIPIIMADKSEIKSILDDLVADGNLTQRQDGLYFYVEQKPIKKELPLFFECHSPNEVEIIIKSFCCEIDDYKVEFLLNKGFSIISKFNKYFREIIFETQKQKLQKVFAQNPKGHFERTFFDKTYYFYIYENQVYISETQLHGDEKQKITQKEVQEFKKVYSFIRRYLSHNTRKYYPHFYITEAIWRRNKSFEQLKDELCGLLGV